MEDDSMLIAAIGLPEATKLLIKSKMNPLGVEFRTPHGMEELGQLIASHWL